MKKGLLAILILAAAGAAAFYFTGGLSTSSVAKKSQPAVLGKALSGKTTAGFLGLENLELLVANALETAKKVTKELPPEVRATVEPFLNKNGREGALGFDPITAQGWASIGIDPKAGVHVSLDSNLNHRTGPIPIFLFKMTDRAKLVAALGRKSISIAFQDKKGPSEIVSLAGGRFLMGQRGEYTALAAISKRIDITRVRPKFDAYLTAQSPALSTAKDYPQAFKGVVAGPRLVGYGSMVGVGELIKGAVGGAVDAGDINYYVERFPSMGMGVTGSGLSAKLVASPAGNALLKKLFVPKKIPALAQYIPAQGWSAVRYSINLAQLFEGLGELIPPSKMELKMGLSMGQALAGAQLGMTWPELALALSGHIAVGFDLSSLVEVQKKGPAAAKWIGVIGVGDTAKADMLLKTLNQKASVLMRGIADTRIEVEGFKGMEYTLPMMTISLLRTRDAILLGPGKASLVSALKTSKGKNLGSTAAGKKFDTPEAFIVSSFELASLAKNIIADQSIPKESRDQVTRFVNTPDMKAFLNKPLVSSAKVENGLHFEAGGIGGMGTMVGLLASIAIPSFMSFQRKAKTAEATMNLRKAFDASVSYYNAEQANRAGDILPRQFPVSAEVPPHADWYAQVCKDGRPQKFKPTASTWRGETWQALSFAIEDPFYYKYTYVSSGTGPGSKFTIRATGDLDCDGKFSTFERIGTVGPSNLVSGGAGLFRNNELE